MLFLGYAFFCFWNFFGEFNVKGAEDDVVQTKRIDFQRGMARLWVVMVYRM